MFWSDLRFLFPIKYVRMYMQLQMGYIIIGFATFSQLSTARKPPNSRVLVSVASRGWSRGQQMYGVQRWREEREWVPAVLCVCERGVRERKRAKETPETNVSTPVRITSGNAGTRVYRNSKVSSCLENANINLKAENNM